MSRVQSIHLPSLTQICSLNNLNNCFLQALNTIFRLATSKLISSVGSSKTFHSVAYSISTLEWLLKQLKLCPKLSSESFPKHCLQWPPNMLLLSSFPMSVKGYLPCSWLKLYEVILAPLWLSQFPSSPSVSVVDFITNTCRECNHFTSKWKSVLWSELSSPLSWIVVGPYNWSFCSALLLLHSILKMPAQKIMPNSPQKWLPLSSANTKVFKTLVSLHSIYFDFIPFYTPFVHSFQQHVMPCCS